MRPEGRESTATLPGYQRAEEGIGGLPPDGRLENWPDDAWKHWRRRRASRARVLAHEGMMPQVAAAYRTMLDPKRDMEGE
jgi:hypothetical protein